ncbi:MAG: hypothetical protein GXP27_16345 [Planctomycetes bacterium]|nr:hypothetical protein [Planctomycetota bacterium]
MDCRCEIAALIRELEGKIEVLAERLEELRECYLFASREHAGHLGDWRDVKECTREVGRLYLVRRLRKERFGEKPCIARWTASGWSVIVGWLGEGNSGYELQQWCRSVGE